MRFIVPLLFLSFAVNAQHELPSYQITPKGLINGVQPEQQYIVISYPGKPQNELYKVFLVAISKSYVSPKDVISKVEGESISINALSNTTIHTKAKPGLPYKLTYVLNIAFKGERVRIDTPSIIQMVFNNPNHGNWYLDISGKKKFLQDSPIYVFNEDGKLIEPEAKKEIESALNEVVSGLLKEVNEQLKGW